MKKTSLNLLFLLFLACTSVAQEKKDITYQITANPSNIDLTPYYSALDQADFQCFRFKTKKRELTFKSGVTLELYSIVEVVAQNISQSKSCYLADDDQPLKYELDLNEGVVSMQAPNVQPHNPKRL
jgi:hypothetical protein